MSNFSNKLLRPGFNFFLKYGLAALISLILSWIHALLPFARQTPFFIAPIAIILSTILGGVGPGILTIILNTLFINYYLLPPFGVFKISSTIFEQELIFLIEGFLIIWLIESQKWIKEEVYKQRQRQSFLAKADKILFSSLDYKTTLDNIAYTVVPSIADWCTVDLLNRKGEIQQAVVAHVDPEKVEWAKDIRRRYQYQQQLKGGPGEVIKTKKSKLYSIISNTLLDRSIKNKEFLKIIKSMGLKSVMIAPIISANKAIGAITFVMSESNRRYDQADLKFAEDIGRRVGQAIENSRLYSTAKREIEERRQTESKLKDAKEQLEVILKNIADGITVQDKTGKLIFVNDAAAHLAGFSSTQKMLNIFRSPQMADKHLKKFEMHDEDGNRLSFDSLPGRRVWQGEKKPEAVIRYRDKLSGQTRWSLTRARPVYDQKRRIQYAVNIVSAISREKEMEKKKDEFISIASHELKTPLTSIKAYTQILRHRLGQVLNKQFSSYLVKMDDQINRLVDLVSELLDVSKIQSGRLEFKPEDFDLKVLIKDVIETMKLTTVKHKFVVNGEKKLLVKADKARIEQVLNNLLVNAIKYSPNGGNIIISDSLDGSRITVKIKDFGIGVSKEEQTKIFDRFYQTQAKKREGLSGLGLGLYISSQIIKRHLGKIWVESESGQGSTFTFSLPVGHQSAPRK